MNGRAYDYNLGRFLSVDPFIQAPGNSQSMNPYSYIMNNPLAGTDPSGYASIAVASINCVKDQAACAGFLSGHHLGKNSETSNGRKDKEPEKPSKKDEPSEELITVTSEEGFGFSFKPFTIKTDATTGGTNDSEPADPSKSSSSPSGNSTESTLEGMGFIFESMYEGAKDFFGSHPVGETITDVTPIVGDAKAIGEVIDDPSVINISAAIIGIIPGGGDAAAAALKGTKNLRNATEAGGDLLPDVIKAVNSNMGHAVDRAVERGIFPDAQSATQGLKDLSNSIKQNGFPEGTIRDSARADRVLVPVGNGGMAAYQVAKNGTAKLKTILIEK